MKKPTFFISSTIYDFKDLRSALKFYLEQQGCTVLASENPDFKVDLAKHSYQACLDAISQSNYFVLFIGTRVGGWYDKINRISITQAEYRAAYKLHKAGNLKILAFARPEVWELRENRNELGKFLETVDIPTEEKLGIAKHPSKRFEDADFIIQFLGEVSRNSETKIALDGRGLEMPTGNWLYTYSSFKDIVDAVQGQILSENPIETEAVKHLLSLELRSNLKSVLSKIGNSIFDPETTVENFYTEHAITKDCLDSNAISVDPKRWSLLSSFGICLLGVKVADRVLDYCLKSTLFVEFDGKTNRITSTVVFDALSLLSNEIQAFRQANTTETLSVIFEYSKKSGYTGDRPVPVPTVKLLAMLHLYDRWINIVKLCISLLAFIETGKYRSPNLRPRSPIPDMVSELDRETITEQELNDYIKRVFT